MAPYGALHRIGNTRDLSIGERRVDRHLDCGGGPIRAWSGCGLQILKQRQPGADVDMERLDVDAAPDAAADQLVTVRDVDAVLVIDVGPIGGYHRHLYIRRAA